MSPIPLDPETRAARRNRAGLSLLVVGLSLGGLLFVVQFLVLPIFAVADPAAHFRAMGWGAVLALPAGMMYLTIPRLLDRYDPEPGYALAGCFAWGAVASTAFSAPVNTCVQVFSAAVFGTSGGDFVSSVVSAPVFEELWKGLGVLGMFYFVRHEFDGVVDGMIYAAFTALGFATVENIIYYTQAGIQGGGALMATAIARGVLSPWAHPLFTAATGIGVGIARETTSSTTRVVAPVFGYACAVFLHACWNGAAWLSGRVGAPLFLVLLPLWFALVVAFVVALIVLVRRRGRILRESLEDEVALGFLSRDELDFVLHAFGRLRARLARGEDGEAFARAVARLGLAKWHAARAMKSQTQTVSFGFIGPLRSEIAERRRRMVNGRS